jgi:hypothetical protein
LLGNENLLVIDMLIYYNKEPIPYFYLNVDGTLDVIQEIAEWM